MTTRYYDNGASGANDGTSWTDAYTSIVTAAAACNAGDVLLCEYRSAESSATALVLSFAAVQNGQNLVLLISVDKDNSDAYRAGCSVSTTSGAAITVVSSNNAIANMGIDWLSDGLLTIGNTSPCYYFDCDLGWDGDLHTNYTFVTLRDVNFVFGDTLSRIYARDRLELYNCTISTSGSSPTNYLFYILTDTQIDTYGCDFSHAATSCDVSWIWSIGGVGSNTRIRLHNTLMPTSWSGTLLNAAVTNDMYYLELYETGAKGTDKRGYYELDSSEGTIITNTSIYLDGTYDGTNKYSLEFISSSGETNLAVKGLRRLLSTFYAPANSTLTVELMTTDATTADTLTDAEFWIEIEHPTAGSEEHGSTIIDSRASGYTQASGTTLTSSSKGAGDWTGELANTNYYKVEQEITSGAAGTHRVWANLGPAAATASKEVYVCPKVVIS